MTTRAWLDATDPGRYLQVTPKGKFGVDWLPCGNVTASAQKNVSLTRRTWLSAATALVPPALGHGASPRVLRFGLTPVFLDERLRLLQQWRLYLEARLGSSVEFVQRGTYAQVMDTLRNGQAHFAWICGYPYVLRQRELQLVAVPQWRGQPLYQSYLIADSLSRVSVWSDLRGRTFAYSDPLSNSGFLYMQHLLRANRQDPARFFGRSFFTHSHRHVVEAVAEGLADAGSVDGYVWETLAELHPELTGRTRVLQKSADFGFPPVVAAAGVDADEARAFAKALFDMPQYSSGRAVLAELRLDRFVPGDAGLFRGIAEMARGQAPAA
jgi:phosphonate transport system substrate-binding protein